VVCPPSATDLWNAVFEHGNPGPQKPPENRLYQSRSEVQPANTGYGFQRRQQILAWLHLRCFRSIFTGAAIDFGVLKVHAQGLQFDVHVGTAVDRHTRYPVPVGHDGQRIDPSRTEDFESTVSIGKYQCAARPSLHGRITAWNKMGDVQHVAVNGYRYLAQNRHHPAAKQQACNCTRPKNTMTLPDTGA
jgi:hypothetical protein